MVWVDLSNVQFIAKRFPLPETGSAIRKLDSTNDTDQWSTSSSGKMDLRKLNYLLELQLVKYKQNNDRM